MEKSSVYIYIYINRAEDITKGSGNWVMNDTPLVVKGVDLECVDEPNDLLISYRAGPEDYALRIWLLMACMFRPGGMLVTCNIHRVAKVNRNKEIS
jgi:hypothetical protein